MTTQLRLYHIVFWGPRHGNETLCWRIEDWTNVEPSLLDDVEEGLVVGDLTYSYFGTPEYTIHIRRPDVKTAFADGSDLLTAAFEKDMQG
jgi:hypothetical protein